MRRKDRKAKKNLDRKRADKFEAEKCIRGSGRGTETEQKRLSEEPSLVMPVPFRQLQVCDRE